MDERNSKKIVSTVVLILFLAFVIFLCYMSLDFLVALKNYSGTSEPTFEDMDGETALMVMWVVGVAMAAPIIAVLLFSGLTILNAVVCLGFAIANSRHSSSSAVRIINIVLSCLFALATALGIVTIILLRVL